MNVKHKDWKLEVSEYSSDSIRGSSNGEKEFSRKLSAFEFLQFSKWKAVFVSCRKNFQVETKLASFALYVNSTISSGKLIAFVYEYLL